MLYLGCQLSAAKGFLAMGHTALKIGANTFQFFSRNPRGSSVRIWEKEDVDAFLRLSQEHGLSHFLAHAPYTLNACSSNGRTREFACETMLDDLSRLEALPGCMYNFHPGSHVGQGTQTAVEQIAGMLNSILTREQSTVVLLETMSGKGSEVGGRFEELRAILDRVELKEKMGVCLDTCHVHDAGYDLVHDLENVLREFDRVVGLDRLRAVHLNDSQNPCGSHKDRHAKIGAGQIGLEAIVRLLNHPLLCRLPFYLETPHELPGYANEISLLKSRYAPDHGGYSRSSV